MRNFIILCALWQYSVAVKLHICYFNDGPGSKYENYDGQNHAAIVYYNKTLHSYNPWVVGSTTYDVQFRHVGSGYLEGGNGAAVPVVGDGDENKAIYNEEIQEEYLLRALEASETNEDCDVFITGSTSYRGKRFRDMMFNATLRRNTATRIGIAPLRKEIISVPVLAPTSSDFSLYNSTVYPNFYSTYPVNTNAISGILDNLYDTHGFRTVAFLYEDDTSVGGLYRRSFYAYLESNSSRNWTVLADATTPSGLFDGDTDDNKANDFYDKFVDDVYENAQRAEPHDPSPDVLVYAVDAIEGSPDVTLKHLHELSFGPKVILISSAIPSAQRAAIADTKLYRGLIINDAFTSTNDVSDAKPIAGFLGEKKALVQQYDETNIYRDEGLELNFLSGSTLIAVQNIQMATVRGNCDTTSNDFVECFRRGIYASCADIGAPNQTQCNALGSEHLDVETWFGSATFVNNQANREFVFSILSDNGAYEAIESTDVNPERPAGFPDRHDEVQSSTWRIIIGVLCSLAIIGCLVGLVCVNKTSEYLIIQSSAEMFLQIILGGGILLYASMLWLIVEISDTTCNGFVWFMYMGWSMCFTGLLVKTHRVDEVFKVARKAHLHDLALLKYMYTPIVVCFFLYLIFWTIFDGMSAIQEKAGHVTYLACNLNSTGMYVGYIMQGALLIWAVVLAFRVRNVPSTFNESALLSASVYNWVVIQTILWTLAHIMTHDKDTQLIMIFLFVYLPVTITLLLLMAPKAHAILQGEGNKVNSRPANSCAFRNTNQGPVASSKGCKSEKGRPDAAKNEYDADIRKLRGEVGRLIADNVKLGGALRVIQNPHVEQPNDVTGLVENDLESFRRLNAAQHGPHVAPEFTRSVLIE
ncbi:hypothetical protein SARC_04884 [Sphaeroforma arctica JP610]|uniref:G-protein coupled receptors family 3 profile domain-containing protein n=1 Tax=Sphaeroforma arctica JP610 TaxID=667725 RepID=A0A0L0G129_9EUKA|nr:hypothetical protein SARC_04884 [Sphaeroforma arctica JP610]KNC82837.1 hypothetical protein SARC_04884 [Sphaeroforma arctica JP610]|eukprot:XP_014156739.1 hypothetical protein SARC_04884 [Sphaeroforma arctica JP610]